MTNQTPINFMDRLKQKTNPGKVIVALGAQWGDEGKGKWIDTLAEFSDIDVRFQGGNNAGHTLVIDGKKHVLHQLPSGILRGGKTSALTSGVVINPEQLAEELDALPVAIQPSSEKLWISERAHVITPWHIALDGQFEQTSSNPIGTTKRGIGPTYAAKASRQGLRIHQYINQKDRAAWIAEMRKDVPEFSKHYESSLSEWQAFEQAAERLAPFVCAAELKLRGALSEGKSLLLEGAQGTLLDINHGTYPFVTSSICSIGGAIASTTIPPQFFGETLGIAKAYLTRVGEGPFPTEIDSPEGAEIAKKGGEFGATTGRPRSCGWFDAVAMRHAHAINGFSGVIVNKIDILTGFSELKIATHYLHPTLGEIRDFPADANVLAACKPVYTSFAGWDEEIPKKGSFSDLPKNAQIYLRSLEELSGIRIVMLGTGPGREDAIYL